jgi:serine/threonine protein kinase
VSSDAHPNALPAGTRIRDYTIVSVIGIGGFSIVYKAMDTALMREVAIKEYFPGGISLRDDDGSVRSQPREAEAFRKGIDSFLNEGKLLAQFDHPALVRVYRFWEERGTAYLAMRLYSGVTLRDAVRAGSWQADEQTLPALLLPVCEALDVLHAANCYHRDVAPDNILLGENDWPVLLDFGAARKAIEGTQVFTAILKPGYAPIEQYGDGELKQGPWTDIYALAGVVHFTLSGNPPTTAISRMLRDAMPRPRDAFAGRLPERWLDAVEKSLAVKPENRPQSIAEFISLVGWDEMPAPVVDVATRVVSVAPSSEAPLTIPLPAGTEKFAAPVADSNVTVLIPTVARPVSKPPPLPQPPVAAPARADRAATHTAVNRPMPPSESLARRSRIWMGALVMLAVVGASLWFWWASSGPRNAPTLASPVGTQPPAKAIETPIPTPTAPPITTATPTTPVIQASPPDVTAPQPKTSVPVGRVSAPAIDIRPAKASTATPANDTAKATVRQPRVDRLQTEPRETAAASRRPARCAGLIDRWQLGAALADEEQRFLTEKCK